MTDCVKDSGGLYYKTLRICNVRQMDKFFNKLGPYIVGHLQTNFNGHTILLQNPYLTNS